MKVRVNVKYAETKSLKEICNDVAKTVRECFLEYDRRFVVVVRLIEAELNEKGKC